MARKTHSVPVRFRPDQLKRIDALKDRLTKDGIGRVSRNAVIEALVEQALPLLERKTLRGGVATEA